jgi:hypothetical protein
MRKYEIIVAAVLIAVALLWCNACVGVVLWYPKGQSRVTVDAPDYGTVDVSHNMEAGLGVQPEIAGDTVSKPQD